MQGASTYSLSVPLSLFGSGEQRSSHAKALRHVFLQGVARCGSLRLLKAVDGDKCALAHASRTTHARSSEPRPHPVVHCARPPLAIPPPPLVIPRPAMILVRSS